MDLDPEVAETDRSWLQESTPDFVVEVPGALTKVLRSVSVFVRMKVFVVRVLSLLCQITRTRTWFFTAATIPIFFTVVTDKIASLFCGFI